MRFWLSPQLRYLRRADDGVVCGETFTPRRNDANTCSAKCRQKLYRETRKGRGTEPKRTQWSATPYDLLSAYAQKRQKRQKNKPERKLSKPDFAL